MKQRPRPAQALQLAAPLLLPLCSCGFSQTINGQIDAQEAQVQQTLCQQVVTHSDLIVSRLDAVLPQSTMDIKLGGSTCALTLSDTGTGKAVALNAPCTIDPPKDAAQYQLQLKLSALTLAADRSGAAYQLSGQGALDVQAELPAFGHYQGTASYRVKDTSSYAPLTQSVDLHLVLSYKSGQSQLDLAIDVRGTRQSIAGTITGPRLSCTLGGSLDAPVLSCS